MDTKLCEIFRLSLKHLPAENKYYDLQNFSLRISSIFLVQYTFASGFLFVNDNDIYSFLFAAFYMQTLLTLLHYLRN